MKNFIILLVFIVNISQSKILDVDHIREVRDVVEDYLNVYPSDKYLYIGIGTSPTPITAFLESKGHDVFTIPLSSFHYGINDYPDLSIIDKQNLFRHFSQFITKSDLKNREVVLVDYTQSGGSLASFGKYFKEYLQLEKVNYYAIQDPSISREDIFNGKIHEYPLLRRSFLREGLARKGFIRYSPYGKYRIKEEKFTRKLKQCGYLRLLKEMISFNKNCNEPFRELDWAYKWQLLGCILISF